LRDSAIGARTAGPSANIQTPASAYRDRLPFLL